MLWRATAAEALAGRWPGHPRRAADRQIVGNRHSKQRQLLYSSDSGNGTGARSAAGRRHQDGRWRRKPSPSPWTELVRRCQPSEQPCQTWWAWHLGRGATSPSPHRSWSPSIATATSLTWIAGSKQFVPWCRTCNIGEGNFHNVDQLAYDGVGDLFVSSDNFPVGFGVAEVRAKRDHSRYRWRTRLREANRPPSHPELTAASSSLVCPVCTRSRCMAPTSFGWFRTPSPQRRVLGSVQALGGEE